MTEAELTKLLDTAQRRPLIEAQTIRRGKRRGELTAKVSDEVKERLLLLGRERALIYKTFLLTGLRKNELATLEVGQIELEDGYLQLDTDDEKSGEGNQVPLRPDLVNDLRQWIVDRKLTPKSLLFTISSGLLRILDRDLKLAGIAKRDERGRTLDVHALRHSFSTLLSKGGVAPRTAQAAMRHSDISLTMNTYTDPKLLDIQKALDVLPSLPLDGGSQFAPQFAPNAAQSGESLTITDKIGKIFERAIAEAEKLICAGSDTTPKSCDTLSSERAKGLEPSTSSLGKLALYQLSYARDVAISQFTTASGRVKSIAFNWITTKNAPVN